MKKLLTAATAAAMVFSSTVAAAATRPEATRLSQPVAQANDLANDEEKGFPIELVLIALGGIAAILAFAGTHHGNSPR